MAAAEAGLSAAFLADVGQAVLAELLEVVLQRFRGAREARQYHQMLLTIAGRLLVSTLDDHDETEPAQQYGYAARGRR